MKNESPAWTAVASFLSTDEAFLKSSQNQLQNEKLSKSIYLTVENTILYMAAKFDWRKWERQIALIFYSHTWKTTEPHMTASTFAQISRLLWISSQNIDYIDRQCASLFTTETNTLLATCWTQRQMVLKARSANRELNR